MAITRGKLTNIQTIPSTVGAVYTNAASTKTFIKGIEVFNSNTINETVKIHSVPNSTGSVGTAGDTNQIIEIVLSPKEKFIYESPGDGRVLDGTNDTIQAVTTTASKVTIEFFGLKDT
jgi:hypothetical protein